MTPHILLLSVSLSVPVTALAQGGGWEIEVHGGGTIASTASGGTTNFPAAGAPLATLVPQFQSRRVSSWFFGDGAELANGVADGLQAFAFPSAARITPLDSVLVDPLAERRDGGGFGFRVSRAITDRFSAEFNFDYNATPLEVPSATSSGIQATAASFQAVFEGFLGPFRMTDPSSPVSVSSSSVIRDNEGSQIVATGAVNINLMTQGRVIPYATVGAGIISNRGDTATADLEGNYSLQLAGVFPFNETDRVSLLHSIDDNVFVGVFGGGVKFFLTQRSGIRVDVRAHLSDNTARTLLDANPNVATASPDLAFVLFTTTNPSVQFSNDPTFFESSLSGPNLNNFEVFEVSGLVSQLLVSVGYFWAF